MEKPTVFFMTSAKYKFAAAEKILGDLLDLVQIEIEVPEHQSEVLREVAAFKAISAYEQIRSPVIIDDGGIMIETYNGWPGALAKYAKRSLTMSGILRLMNGVDNRRAVSVTSIAYCDADFFVKRNPIVFEAEHSGQIADLPLDTKFQKNAGFDQVFIPEGSDSVFARLLPEELEQFSERYAALHKFHTWAQVALIK